MGRPAARVTDMTTCPMVAPGPVPHVGGPIMPPCEPTVIVCGMPQARIGDQALCAAGGPAQIITGVTVLVGGSPAARIGDSTSHGGVIVTGAPTVLIGDAGGGGAGGSAGARSAASKQRAPTNATPGEPTEQQKELAKIPGGSSEQKAAREAVALHFLANSGLSPAEQDKPFMASIRRNLSRSSRYHRRRR